MLGNLTRRQNTRRNGGPAGTSLKVTRDEGRHLLHTRGRTNAGAFQEKGQVTIPTEIRKKLGLKKGDYVAFIETDQGVLIAPREVIAMDALDRIGAALKEQGITLETLIERSHASRSNVLDEHQDHVEE